MSEKCQRYACRIQDCLSANGFDETKCGEEVEELKKCCFKLWSEKCESANCQQPGWLKEFLQGQ